MNNKFKDHLCTDKYQQLKSKTDTGQQFADMDFDSMLQQLANKIVNDSRLLSIIESSLTDLVFQQEVIGIKHYSIKLTPEYLLCKRLVVMAILYLILLLVLLNIKVIS